MDCRCSPADVHHLNPEFDVSRSGQLIGDQQCPARVSQGQVLTIPALLEFSAAVQDCSNA
jgi:hypothetical protein